eukprot:scaffold17115_cov23-Tisochrysis_lutea.AAC.1
MACTINKGISKGISFNHIHHQQGQIKTLASCTWSNKHMSTAKPVSQCVGVVCAHACQLGATGGKGDGLDATVLKAFAIHKCLCNGAGTLRSTEPCPARGPFLMVDWHCEGGTVQAGTHTRALQAGLE